MMRASSLPPLSRFLLLAAALLALAVLLAQDGLPVAQAQQATAYVSNTGQTAAQQSFRLSTAATVYAQGFTTGSQTGGYTLGSIDLVIANAPNQAQRDTIRAELWSAVASGNNAGEPNAKLSDLTVPVHPVSAGTVRFTAPANTTLSASTTYFLMIYTTGNFDVSVDVTSETDEDTGATTGWSINDRVHEPLTGSNTNTPSGVSAWRVGGDTNIIAQIGVNAPATAAPSNLQATAIAGGVRLSWNAPTDPAGVITGYEVLRRKSSQSRMRPYVVDTGSTDTSYTDRGAAKQGETYTYQVKAKVGSLSTEASNSAAVTIPGTCPISGASPVDIPISNVPIVVTSTVDDYFALYVLRDVQGNTVELPVLVKQGEAGTTTLADNLAPLPVEKYRVKKYQVANPADVDGDCIDDITELADLGTKNPVNPAESVDISNGAVSITDHAAFQELTHWGYVKFTIINPVSDRPTVYFHNTFIHPGHMSFAQALGFDTSLPMIKGELIYYPNVVAPDGSLGVYGFQMRTWWYGYNVGETGTGENNAFDSVASTFEALAASMPFLENNLAYHPVNQGNLLLYQKDKALYDASRVNVLLEDDIPEADFISLNQGQGYGYLRVMSPDERPNPRDIVIYETLPNDLPRVAGVITTVPQTPLSHVNLRAVQDDIPNAFIRDALDDSDIDDLIGSHVRYTVTQSGYTSGYTLRAATRAEVDAHYESSRPATTQTPERDLSVIGITALGDVEFDDWDAFGVKAANVAVLGTLGFPEGTVPDGFAVPFYFYDEFMKNAILAEETLFGKKKWDDDDKFTLPAGTKLSAAVTAMLAHPKFQTDYEIQEEMLDDLRDAIKDAESPQWITQALTTMHATYPEGQSLRYRSSTNNEDLPGYSGAGLYSSKTQDPDETAEDGIDKSIKGVWASLWNFRAFVERDFHRVDHTRTAMGVLVHPNYSDELANGVAVSFDPFSGREGAYYVNTQVGEDLVTNPEAHSRPEEILLLPDGRYDVLAYSNQKEPRGPLMSDAQMSQLRRHLAVIHDRFKALYQPAPGEPFAMEIEFKITSANKLSIKQARPWVFQRQLNRPPTVAVPLPDVSMEPGGDRAISLSSVFHDPDGEELTFSHVSSNTWVASGWVSGATLSLVPTGVGTATITVTAEDPRGNQVSDEFQVTVAFTHNRAPTVSSGMADATVVSESGTRQVSLFGVFSDADEDALTITADSSNGAVATVSVAADYSALTVAVQSRGTATITVTADDGNGGTVSDTFTVSVKAAPVVASALADLTGLESGATQEVSLAGVFSDPDRDTLTITAASSDDAKATVTVAADQSNLSVAGVAEGTATITVTARDSDGNTASDAFDVSVAAPQQQGDQTPQETYADLIADMKEWRDDPCCASNKDHTDRWDRALLAFGETVSDTTLTAMTADEAQGYADRGWTRWVDVATALGKIESGGQQGTPNQPPTVAGAIDDATIVNESGSLQVSLSGVFSDADKDTLTITAASYDEAVATVSVAPDQSSLTVNAHSRGTADITVTADDGNGGTVSDTFSVTVKAAPVVASPLSDVSGLEVGATQEVSLSGVFSDADGDSLTITAASSNDAIATVTVASDGSALTLTGVAEGTATITVTAQDPDGNRVSDTFEAPVAKRYASLIAQMKEWRNDPRYASDKAHTDRWDRTLLTFGETVADTSLTAMTADEAQGYADRGWTRWVEVVEALREIEAAGPPPNQAPTVSAAIDDATIVNQSGTKQVSLSGVFSDADSLTVTAASSDEAVATVAVALDYSTLTATAKSRGTATINVTADDGKGGTVSDAFTVTVKAAPTVASAIGDVTGLAAGATQDITLSGVFRDADGDALTITAASSDDAKATVTVAADQSKLTLAGVAEGSATITVTARDTDGNTVSDAFDVSVAAQQQDPPPNQAPTVSAAIDDATIVNQSGTKQVSLSGVFDDANGDSLTVTAASSDEAVATVAVASDHSSLTVNAHSRGTADITVTADDGNGGTVSDTFSVTVKAAPVVASSIGDVSLEEGGSQDISLSGVFRDADGDSLTITAASSVDAKATVTVAADQSKLTLAGVAEGSATITVTARDTDGNTASDAFTVSVDPKPEEEEPEGGTSDGSPTVVKPLADISLVGPPGWEHISLSGVFHDPDGDDLTITVVSSDHGVASMYESVYEEGSTLTVLAMGTGTATITVTADDPDGNQVSDEFQVTVTPASQEG